MDLRSNKEGYGNSSSGKVTRSKIGFLLDGTVAAPDYDGNLVAGGIRGGETCVAHWKFTSIYQLHLRRIRLRFLRRRWGGKECQSCKSEIYQAHHHRVARASISEKTNFGMLSYQLLAIDFWLQRLIAIYT